jgi:hypothetical protein
MEMVMAERKPAKVSKGGTAGRSPSAAWVARAYGLTMSQALALIAVVGNDLNQLKAAAARLKFTRPAMPTA